MAESPSLFDQFVTKANQVSDIYAKVTLAKKGVATTPARVETNGAANPVVEQGAPAAVGAADSLLASLADSAQKAYTARKVDQALPWAVGALVGVLALVMVTRALKH